MLRFLDRYAIRISAGLGAFLALPAALYGWFTGMKPGECAALVIGTSLLGLIALLPRKEAATKKTPYVSPYLIRYDDDAVTVMLNGQRHEAVRWDDLVVVGISIVDSFLPEPYWVLAGAPGKGGCIYPSSAVGAQEMLRELQRRLPGFDNIAVIKAMGMMAGGLRVWERPGWKASHNAAKKRLS